MIVTFMISNRKNKWKNEENDFTFYNVFKVALIIRHQHANDI